MSLCNLTSFDTLEGMMSTVRTRSIKLLVILAASLLLAILILGLEINPAHADNKTSSNTVKCVISQGASGLTDQ